MEQPEQMEFEEMSHPQLRAYLKRLEINLKQVKRRLREFEARFGAETDEMFSRVSAEEIEADTDLSEWAGEREMMRRLDEQKSALEKRLK